MSQIVEDFVARGRIAPCKRIFGRELPRPVERRGCLQLASGGTIRLALLAQEADHVAMPKPDVDPFAPPTGPTRQSPSPWRRPSWVLVAFAIAAAACVGLKPNEQSSTLP